MEKQYTFTYKKDFLIPDENISSEKITIEGNVAGLIRLTNFIGQNKNSEYRKLVPRNKELKTMLSYLYWYDSGYYTFARQSGVSYFLGNLAYEFQKYTGKNVIILTPFRPQMQSVINMQQRRASALSNPNSIRIINLEELEKLRGLRDYFLIGDNAFDVCKKCPDIYNFYRILDDADDILFMDTKNYVKTEMFTKTTEECFTSTGKRCWCCGMEASLKGTLEMHRLQPGREGGQYVMGNVIGICKECHRVCEGLNAEQLYNLSPYGLEVGRSLSSKFFLENNILI